MDTVFSCDTASEPEREFAPLRAIGGPPPWQASLQLRFGASAGCTRLVQNQHRGPLRVQRVLYPEGPKIAHALLLHPPGGIAGGDELDLRIALEPAAQLLCTTPGASKWYHGERGTARQSVHLEVADDACLEWLPQEAILFDGADASQQTLIELDHEARMFGWDIVQFGRVAAGHRWHRGRWRQRVLLRRGGRERWREIADLTADDRLLTSQLGMAGHAVLGCAWAAAPGLATQAEDLLASLRGRAAVHALPCGISWLPAPTELLLIRVLGLHSEPVRALLEDLWHTLRPQLLGRAAQRPRIWDT